MNGNSIHDDCNLISIATLPDGHFVVAVGGGGDSPGDVRLYRNDCTLVHTFKGHTDYTRAAVTPDGQHIISGSGDKRVKVWSVTTKSLVSTCVRHTADVGAVAAMPDSHHFLSGSEDGAVCVWLLNGAIMNAFRLHTSSVWAVVALLDNQHALSGSFDKTVKLFNVNDGTVLRTIKHNAKSVVSLALLPDGLRFVSGAYDNTARIAYHGLAPL